MQRSTVTAAERPHRCRTRRHPSPSPDPRKDTPDGQERVFISFDYDHDSFLKEALVAQAKLPDSPFELADRSIKEHINGNWKDKATTRIRSLDIVAVIRGEHTNTAAGVSAEVKIAQDEGKPYFLLAGYKERTNVKPTAAKATDKLYKWTWENLKSLIVGNR